MNTYYDIYPKDTEPYYEVVVVCDECYRKVAKCECVEPENVDEDEDEFGRLL